MQHYSLQHQTWLLSSVASTTGCFFYFGSVSSFFLELFLHSFPVAYWAPTDLESSSFSVLSFCLFILFMGFSRQEYWSGLPFPSPVDHVLSELSTITHLSWGALYGMAHSFIELDKAVVYVISLVSFLWFWFSFCPPLMDRGLWKLHDGRDWLWGSSVQSSCSVVSNSLQSHGLQAATLLCPWNFPGKNREVGCISFSREIFPTPGMEPMSPTLAGEFFATDPPGKPL